MGIGVSGINPATIKKYEYGIRNPKPDQLLKITNALGISINLFMDFDIETVSDVLSLLFKLDEQVDMRFEAEKDENGEFIPSTIKLSFQNAAINQKLCTYLKAKQIKENLENSKEKLSAKDDYAEALSEIEQNIEDMSFKEFDLSEYIHALEDFKVNQTDTIIKHWGSIDNFNMFIQRIKDDEENVAKLAIQHFGSIEKYTEEMKYNLEHISEIMDKEWNEEAEKIAAQSDLLYGKLTVDLTYDVSSPKIQKIVYEILEFIKKQSSSVTLDKPLINILIDSYSNDYVKNITDKKYGDGASDYIVKAFRYYSENNTPSEK